MPWSCMGWWQRRRWWVTDAAGTGAGVAVAVAVVVAAATLVDTGSVLYI